MHKSAFKKLEGIHELHESVNDQQSLLSLLKKELSSYSIFEFIKIQAFIEKDSKDLPCGYKEKFKEKMLEQLFVNFKSILSCEDVQNQQLDMEQYLGFLERFGSRLADMDEMPRMTVLYYFCAMYNIFITQTPPHPEGTPFPGGFVVEKVGEEYYCPVKEKQEDNIEAICKFCVARQMDMQ
ncbi:MAG: DUF2115 family protein [Candidatus Methanoperedens sp.]|nr:DUF2115 family protein [Candidatus Methanoperedens sp.]